MKKQIFAALAALAITFAAHPAVQAADYAPVTVDDYGRKVTVTAMPQKVLTFGPNCTELFIALGLGGKIAGNTLDNHSRGPLPEYAAEYARVPELNYGSATREAALTSGKHMVSANKALLGRHVERLAALAAEHGVQLRWPRPLV